MDIFLIFSNITAKVDSYKENELFLFVLKVNL